MTFQGVPWFVGGGAENPPEAARLLAHIATHGAAGVLLPGDCAVLPLSVPAGQVRVTPGSVVVPNTKPNAGGEVYLARNPEDEPVAITATGSGETRRDLVFVRIADPQYADEPAPASVTQGRYVWPQVAAGVSAGTRTVQDAIAQGVLPAGTVGVALALVTMPPNTGTVTADMIADLRSMPAPRSQRRQFVAMPSGAVTLNASAFGIFPPAASWPVEVPTWATHAIVHVVEAGLKYGTANVAGQFRVGLGDIVGQAVGYDVEAVSGKERGDFHALDTLAIPKSHRGATLALTMQGRRTSSSGGLQSNAGAAIIADIEFQERIG